MPSDLNSNLGIYISFLHPNGAAEATENIQEGDQIISVNNISFLNISHQGTRNSFYSYLLIYGQKRNNNQNSKKILVK